VFVNSFLIDFYKKMLKLHKKLFEIIMTLCKK